MRTHIKTTATFIAGLFFAVGVFFNLDSNHTFFANDQALTFSVVHQMNLGEVLLAGPPSHVGGRHMGPYYYWLMSLFQMIGGGGALGAIFVSAAVTGLAVLAIGLYVGRGRCLSLVAVFLVACSGYLDTIRIPWHPHILLILSALFLWSTKRFFEQGLTELGWWAFSGSILAQTHSAAGPFVVGVGGVVGLVTLRRVWRREFGESSWIYATGGWALFLATLVPLVIYNLNFDGNLFKLMRVHGAHGSHAGMAAASKSLWVFLSGQFFGPWGGVGVFQVSLIGIILVLVASRGGLRMLRDGILLRPGFWLAVLGGTAMTAIALSRFAPPLYTYYWSVLLPLPLMAAGFLGGVIERSSGILRAASIAVLVLLLWSGFSGVRRYFGQPFVPFHTLGAAERVVGAMHDLAEEHRINGKVEILTRLLAKSMKNTYNFLYQVDRFDQLEVSYKFKELSAAPASDVPEKFDGDFRFIVFCPVPYSAERKRIMAPLRKNWAVLGDRFSLESGGKDRCLIRLLQRRRPSTS